MFLRSGCATELVALSRRGRGICHMAAARASHLSHSLHRVATSRKPCPAGCSMAISTTVCTGSSQALNIAGIQGRAVVMLVLSKLHADSVRAKDAMRLPLPRAKGFFFWGSSRSLVRCNCGKSAERRSRPLQHGGRVSKPSRPLFSEGCRKPCLHPRLCCDEAGVKLSLAVCHHRACHHRASSASELITGVGSAALAWG